MSARVALGKCGESLAAAYLETVGHTVLERNWRCPHGEIDLIISTGRTVAVVEVKTRRTLGYGHPFEAITGVKLQRLHLLARHWAQHRHYSGPLRVDAVSVLIRDGAGPCIEHLEGLWR